MAYGLLADVLLDYILFFQLLIWGAFCRDLVRVHEAQYNKDILLIPYSGAEIEQIV